MEQSPNIPNAVPKRRLLSPQAVVIFLIELAGLITIFVVLNYFSILPLSSIFPGFLGWLPHKEAVVTSVAPPLKPVGNVSISSLPIDPSNPDVFKADIYYVFPKVEIKKIDQTTIGTQLEMIIPGNDVIRLPPLVIDTDTEIVRGRAGGADPATFQDLKIEDRINLNASYNLKNKTWKIWHIYILYDDASKSGNINKPFN